MIYRPNIAFFTRESERLISTLLIDEIQVLCKKAKNPRPYKDALDLVLNNPVPYDIRGPISRLE